MPLPLETLRELNSSDATTAWQTAVKHALDICREPLSSEGFETAVRKRDDSLGDLDLFLATAGWDLWPMFRTAVRPTSEELRSWWTNQPAGRAVLILDGLSLRELPWLVEGAANHGFRQIATRATAAEIPSETNTFAKALGFSQRSSLANNGAGSAHHFAGAWTESTSLPWADATALIPPNPSVVYWYSGFDDRLHDLSEQGNGPARLCREANQLFLSSDFWAFVRRLATGRELVITSDHGYAVSGAFADVRTEKHAKYLKEFFGGQRYAEVAEVSGSIPPLELELEASSGPYTFVLGRRKWKVAGGFPVLSHGGLSILEVLVPFVELRQ